MDETPILPMPPEDAPRPSLREAFLAANAAVQANPPRQHWDDRFRR